jgi:hypothetical protein
MAVRCKRVTARQGGDVVAEHPLPVGGLALPRVSEEKFRGGRGARSGTTPEPTHGYLPFE